MLSLGIETSGMLCSVAWQENNLILLEYNYNIPNNHSAMLSDLINQGFKKLNKTPDDIDFVAVASGPGSFTGLRIGMSYAKGFCYALGITIISVSNFEVLASQVVDNKFPIYTLIDANRGRVYEGIFKSDKLMIDDKMVIKTCEFNPEDDTKSTIIVNNSDLIESCNLNQKIQQGQFGARYICDIGYKKYLNGLIDDLYIIEPLYIQEFAGIA